MTENNKEHRHAETTSPPDSEQMPIVTSVQGNRDQINTDFIKHVKMTIIENKHISNVTRFRNTTIHLGYGSTDEEIENIMQRIVSDVEFEIKVNQLSYELTNPDDIDGHTRIHGVEYIGSLTPESAAEKFNFLMDYEIKKLMGRRSLNYFFNLVNAESWMGMHGIPNQLDRYNLYAAIVTYAFSKVASNTTEDNNPIILTTDTNAYVDCNIRIVNPILKALTSTPKFTDSPE